MSGSARRSERILILEDDDVLRESLKDLLEDEGYGVSTVASGEEAVRSVHSDHFDLIVADVRMKGLSGLDALEQVKDHQPDIGRIVMTGYASEADSMRAARLGVGEYLKKPFRSEIFLGAIEKILQDRRRQVNVVRRAQAYRSALLWSYQQWAEKVAPLFAVQETQEPGQVAHCARNTGRRLGFGSAAGEEVELATLIYLSRSQAGMDAPPISELAWPEGVAAIVNQLEDRPADSSEPLSLPAAVAASACHKGGFAIPPEILRACPEDLLKTHEIQSRGALRPETGDTPEAAQKRRNLLALGEALWEGGNQAAGQQAYLLLAEEARPSQEKLKAQLWLTALARGQGDSAGAWERVLKAVSCARQLRSEAAASGLLDSALWMARLGHSARELLEEAAALSGSAPSPTSSLIRLALVRTGDGALQARMGEDVAQLLSRENRHELIRSSDWLLPLLLDSGSFSGQEGLQQRALSALAAEQPALLEAHLGPDQPTARRRLIVRALAESGAGGVEVRLRALISDPDPWIRDFVKNLARAPENAPPTLRFFSLGGFDVFQGEKRLGKWHSQKTRFLLAWLVAQTGSLISDDALIEAFWPDDCEVGRTNINVNCSHLRRMLRLAEANEQQPQYVLRHEGGVRFNGELPRWHDLELLEESLRRGFSQAASVDEKFASFSHVNRLYRGPYLDGCYLDFAVRRREELEERVLQALLELSQLQAARQAYREAVEITTQVLARDACRQEATLLAMRSYRALGQPEQALRAYDTCSKALDRELGILPNRELDELYDEISS